MATTTAKRFRKRAKDVLKKSGISIILPLYLILLIVFVLVKPEAVPPENLVIAVVFLEIGGLGILAPFILAQTFRDSNLCGSRRLQPANRTQPKGCGYQVMTVAATAKLAKDLCNF